MGELAEKAEESEAARAASRELTRSLNHGPARGQPDRSIVTELRTGLDCHTALSCGRSPDSAIAPHLLRWMKSQNQTRSCINPINYSTANGSSVAVTAFTKSSVTRAAHSGFSNGG